MSERTDIVKKIIKDNFEDAQYGIFFCRNNAGDVMTNLYLHEEIAIDICYRYQYFEVFGLDFAEIMEVSDFYSMYKDASEAKIVLDGGENENQG